MKKTLYLLIICTFIASIVTSCGSTKEDTAVTKKITTTKAATQTIESSVAGTQANTQTQTQAQTTTTAVQTTKREYTDYSKYLSYTFAQVKSDFGTDYKSYDCTSTVLYKYGNVGFHFDNLDEIDDTMPVRIVRVYGSVGVSEYLDADMTYNELKKAVADIIKPGNVEKYSAQQYSVQVQMSGVYYTFYYSSNPSKSSVAADYVDISK